MRGRVPGERMSEEEVIREVSGSRKVVVILVAIVVVLRRRRGRDPDALEGDPRTRSGTGRDLDAGATGGAAAGRDGQRARSLAPSHRRHPN